MQLIRNPSVFFSIERVCDFPLTSTVCRYFLSVDAKVTNPTERQKEKGNDKLKEKR